jgi:hypothetical protein
MSVWMIPYLSHFGLQDSPASLPKFSSIPAAPTLSATPSPATPVSYMMNRAKVEHIPQYSTLPSPCPSPHSFPHRECRSAETIFALPLWRAPPLRPGPPPLLLRTPTQFRLLPEESEIRGENPFKASSPVVPPSPTWPPPHALHAALPRQMRPSTAPGINRREAPAPPSLPPSLSHHLTGMPLEGAV